MARAPSTGFYFEPIAERLALVVEGSPFPSDNHWAWLGDPIGMTPQQAALLCAVRWPGIDPKDLQVEFDLNFERAVAAKEEDDQKRKTGQTAQPQILDLDVEQLLSRAHELRRELEAIEAGAGTGGPPDPARVQELLDEARTLAEPRSVATIAVPQAPPQSTRLLQPPPPPAEAAETVAIANIDTANIHPDLNHSPVNDPEPAPLEDWPLPEPKRPRVEKPAGERKGPVGPSIRARNRPGRELPPEPVPEPSASREPPAAHGPPKRPRIEGYKPPVEPKETAAEKPEGKPPPRRPNIRDKR